MSVFEWDAGGVAPSSVAASAAVGVAAMAVTAAAVRALFRSSRVLVAHIVGIAAQGATLAVMGALTWDWGDHTTATATADVVVRLLRDADDDSPFGIELG
eukprot:gene28891-52243_t